MGTSMEAIQNAYQGFAKQNYTMLDNLKLGYGGTKTEMERLLKDAEKISGIKYDISNLNDVYSAIHVIQTEMGITGTTAKEASSTIQGSIGMLKASLENLVTGFGDANANMSELAQNVVDSFGSVVTNLMPVIQNIATSIPGAVSSLLVELVSTIVGIAPDLIDAGVQLVVSLLDGIMRQSGSIAKSAVDIIT